MISTLPHIEGFHRTYGGGFHVGGSSQEDGSLLVQQSAARVSSHISLGPETGSCITGDSYDLC